MTSLVLKERTPRASLLGPVPKRAPRMVTPRRRRPSLRPGVLVAWVALIMLAPFLLRGLKIANADAAVSQTTTRSITASADDVRAPEHGDLVTDETVAYLGAGAGAHANVAGFRFANLKVPPGAIIDAVQFSLVKVGYAADALRLDLAFEATDSAVSFSDQSSPSSRISTGTVLAISEGRQLTDGRRYTLGDPTKLALSLQEVINRPGWRVGNTVVLIAYGAVDPAYSRLAFATYDAGPDRAPQLLVTYRMPTPSPAAK